MTAYFVPTATECLSLLVSAVRSHQDLEVIAPDAEADVIAHYTRQGTVDLLAINTLDPYSIGRAYHLGDGVWVGLKNYTPDASSCTDAGLVLALRRTIADVINWRLAKRADAPHLQSVSTQAGTFKTPRRDAVDPFPPGDWPYRLKRWDLRPVSYAT